MKYQIFEPGKYFDWEKKIVEETIATFKKGPADGCERPTAPISDYELLKYNHLWDPYNPLFNNKEVAQKAGYQNVPGRPAFKTPRAPTWRIIPYDIADKFYYGQGVGYTEFFVPVYAGDSFTTTFGNLAFEDITTQGSDVRIFEFGGIAEAYNQRGELVMRNYCTLKNGYKKIIDNSPKPSVSEYIAEWVAYYPPGHYTTDEEWEYIKELWDKEYIRGEDTLYWEDVKIGDEPTWICTGPISTCDMVELCHDDLAPYGGGGGIIARNNWKNLGGFYRDRYGQYLPRPTTHYNAYNIPGARCTYDSQIGPGHIIRMLTNYIGDAGFVTKISPRLMNIYKEMQIKRPGGEFMDKVPYMKGKGCTVHGGEGDTIIAKGYVTDKYTNSKGEHIIDITCWCESLDKRITEVVGASAKLPSKK